LFIITAKAPSHQYLRHLSQQKSEQIVTHRSDFEFILHFHQKETMMLN